MRKIVLLGTALALFIGFNACKKSDSSSNKRTMESFSGSYMITALVGSAPGISLNLYDSLPACEKDNIIQLSATGAAEFMDVGVACIPSSDSSGTWSLSPNADSIYVAGRASFIKSWDDKTLVLTNLETLNVGIPIQATLTTTLTKN